MGSLALPELTLDCRLLTREFLAEVSSVHGASDKISKLDCCVNRLRDEMKKIDAFKRELPLCMLLLNHAISAIDEELMQLKRSNAQPVLEEFIPLKKSCGDEKDEQVENPCKEKDSTINSSDKMNWMSSVQLWNSDNQHHYPNTDLRGDNKPSSNLDNNKEIKAVEIDRPNVDDLFQIGKNRTARRVFVPFKECDGLPGVPGLSLGIPETRNSREVIFSSGFSSKSSSSRSGSSSATIVQSNCKAGQQQGASRKQRRCWSPELHRRFVAALQQLGGPQVATPKQIRELMQVDGLTNDEVKSHLQKYRLHTRKAPQTTNTSTAQPLVLGKLFMSSKEKYGECSKPSNSHSGSPQGPLHLNGSDSMEDEDEDGE